MYACLLATIIIVIGSNSVQFSLPPGWSRVLADDERRVQSGEDSEARVSTSPEVSFELIGHLGMPQRSTEGRRLRMPPEQELGLHLWK